MTVTLPFHTGRYRDHTFAIESVFSTDNDPRGVFFWGALVTVRGVPHALFHQRIDRVVRDLHRLIDRFHP